MFKLFTASWCSGCKVVHKEYEGGYPDGLIVLDVDTAEGKKEAEAVGLRSLPALQVSEDKIITGAAAILQELRA